MSGWEGLEGIIDVGLIASADCAVVHYSLKAISSACGASWDVGFADIEEMRSETTNEPLEFGISIGRSCVVEVERNHVPSRRLGIRPL